MGKRKRSAKSDEEVRASVPSVSPSPGDADGSRDGGAHGSTVTAVDRSCQEYSGPLRTIQVVVGSYERVLHGVTATLPSPRSNSNEGKPACRFADTFLFNAHSSAIRCLAVSPVSQAEGAKPGSKVILASGGTDERINLYHLSTSPPADDGSRPILPTLTEKPAMENPKNRELGSLLHHSAAITALEFPTRSKLLSSAEDNTVAITRTRDWTALSTIKAPLTRAQGRPSGDTAPPGAVPSGINDFAVHPSRKVMLSVSKGERCMRLWNLVTGRKAGVLRFDKTIMQAIGGSKQSLSEARKMAWNSTGDQFVVCYDRGAVVYQAVSRLLGGHTGSKEAYCVIYMAELQAKMPGVGFASVEVMSSSVRDPARLSGRRGVWTRAIDDHLGGLNGRRESHLLFERRGGSRGRRRDAIGRRHPQCSDLGRAWRQRRRGFRSSQRLCTSTADGRPVRDRGGRHLAGGDGQQRWQHPNLACQGMRADRSRALRRRR